MYIIHYSSNKNIGYMWRAIKANLRDPRILPLGDHAPPVLKFLDPPPVNCYQLYTYSTNDQWKFDKLWHIHMTHFKFQHVLMEYIKIIDFIFSVSAAATGSHWGYTGLNGI